MANPEDKIVKIIDKDIHTRGVSVDQVGDKGALAVTLISGDTTTLPGMAIPTSDAIVVTYPDGDTEVYTYKTGGTSGTTVATVTLVYSSGDLVSAVKVIP